LIRGNGEAATIDALLRMLAFTDLKGIFPAHDLLKLTIARARFGFSPLLLIVIMIGLFGRH
ncbi:MAG: hypothetical protein K1563_03940, partial [Candidatus Thiodiazotropha sp. (ex. Lucinisca nassula)]|nr:hypothetical protein [Candidatus Thiodiazotropha sp. (ex. Lucinisca nassula)]